MRTTATYKPETQVYFLLYIYLLGHVAACTVLVCYKSKGNKLLAYNKLGRPYLYYIITE